MNNPEHLSGIILAGGKSKRFGKDKALARYGETTLLGNAIEIIKPLTSDIVISTNHPEHDQFGYRTIKDEIKNIGPLGGILSGLRKSNTEYNIILSVDMPLINRSYLRFLLERSKNTLITIGTDTTERRHPMCGIYSKHLLPYIEATIIKKKYSLHHLIDICGRCKIVPPPINAFFYSDKIFHNINTPQDYMNYICSQDTPPS